MVPCLSSVLVMHQVSRQLGGNLLKLAPVLGWEVLSLRKFFALLTGSYLALWMWSVSFHICQSLESKTGSKSEISFCILQWQSNFSICSAQKSLKETLSKLVIFNLRSSAAALPLPGNLLEMQICSPLNWFHLIFFFPLSAWTKSLKKDSWRTVYMLEHQRTHL